MSKRTVPRLSKDELLAKALKPGDEAMRLHPFYRGKIEMVPRCSVRSVDDFAIWYTPGVAEPCKAIARHPDAVYEHTNKGNTVAVVTDGTRVLGLGDLGPEAALPVMEGKALIFKYLGGVDAIPVCLDTKDADEIIRTIQILQPCFGGVNLEDIANPKCFKILDTLRRDLSIPVWHDDQQGTAAVTVAGLLNALKIVRKRIEKIRVALVGAGAANVAIARLLMLAGADPGRLYVCDSKGLLHPGRRDLLPDFPEKWELAQKTNAERRTGGIPEAMEGADVLIALSRPGPHTIAKDWIRTMAKDSIVFVCANPTPEIWPWEAKDAGARIVATGRSDFPNQVNNSLGFPGIFRGALDVRARTITDEMCLAAARELAKTAEDHGLREDRLLPTMDDWELFPREAVAVGLKAIEQKVARVKISKEKLFEMADSTIRRARGEVTMLMKKGFIPPPPPEPRAARKAAKRGR